MRNSAGGCFAYRFLTDLYCPVEKVELGQRPLSSLGYFYYFCNAFFMPCLCVCGRCMFIHVFRCLRMCICVGLSGNVYMLLK